MVLFIFIRAADRKPETKKSSIKAEQRDLNLGAFLYRSRDCKISNSTSIKMIKFTMLFF